MHLTCRGVHKFPCKDTWSQRARATCDWACDCLFEVSSVDTHRAGTALALHCTSQSILSWRANVNLSPGRQNDVPSLTQRWPSTLSARSYLVQYDVLHLQLRPSRWVDGSRFFWNLLQSKATTKYIPWPHSCLAMRNDDSAIPNISSLHSLRKFVQVWFRIHLEIYSFFCFFFQV